MTFAFRTLFLSFIAVSMIIVASADTRAAMSPSGEMVFVQEYVDAEQLVIAKDYNGAIPLLNAALKLRPDHANAWNLLGFSHRKLGKFDDAEKYYEAALTVNPGHTGAMNYMGQLYIQTGRPAKAKELLEKLKVTCAKGCSDLTYLEKAVKEGVAGKY